MVVHSGITPDDIEKIAKLAIVPIEDSNKHDTPRVTPRECFLGIHEYPDNHYYRRIFTFVDFDEHANNFLKACGAKVKPDCPDIVNMLLRDPSDFLEKTCTKGRWDLEKYVKGPLQTHTCADCQYSYLTELRSIAIGYERLSEDHKEKMREAPIFVGYRVLSDQSKPQLLKASDILIADDLENRRIFERDAWLAPQDETLESA